MKGLKIELKRRLILIFLLLAAIMLGLLIRFFYIQLVKTDEYHSGALRQRLREIEIQPKRGIIYDREGVEFAVSAGSPTVVAIPSDIINPQQTADKLAEILELEREEIYDRLTKQAGAVYLARKIADDKAEAIKKLDIAGITFTEESKRYYPKDSLASHLIGFSGIDNQGLQGVELSYDQYLRGKPGRKLIESDAAGRQLPEGIEDYIAPEDGDNVYLTIDSVLQYIAERELDRAMLLNEAEAATIMMMDPQTGELLALANRPTYDPNEFLDYTPDLWRNRAVSDTYEPGSTFKIITAAAGLEEGVVQPSDKFHDPGHIEIAGQNISCWKDGGHGMQTFAEVVENSCNPGFVQVGQRIGAENFYKYIEAFDFSKRTGLDLPGEAEGLAYDLEDVGPVELATISFGHGITVTPIQLITAISAVANDGQLLRPRIVKKIANSRGEVIKENQPEKIKQVISANTSQTLRELLTGVVEDGSGENAAVDGYLIGGKTGTARHYGRNLYDASFVGMLPANDPQLLTLVVLHGVSSYPYYGSQVAAPVFKNVVEDAVRHLGIEPGSESDKIDFETEKEVTEVPQLKGLELKEAERKIYQSGLNIRLEGQAGTVTDQFPEAGVEVYKGSTIVLFFDAETRGKDRFRITVPDLTGKSVAEALELSAELGLELNPTHQGQIVSQQPEAGATIESGGKIEIKIR